MSPSTACCVGRSSSRWIGITGNSCLIAQLSGIDWNSEKLQKYVSDSSASSACEFLGHVVELPAPACCILRQMAQNRFSAMAPLLERQVAAAEQVHRHVERLLRVVVALEHVARREVAVASRAGRPAAARRRRGPSVGTSFLAELRHAEHVEDQQRCGRRRWPGRSRRRWSGAARRRRRRPAACGRPRRWRIPAACSSRSTRSWSASRRSRRPARRRRRGTPARRPPCARSHVDAGRLVQRALDVADVGDLAAEVEVQQLEAVLPCRAPSAPRARAGSR